MRVAESCLPLLVVSVRVFSEPLGINRLNLVMKAKRRHMSFIRAFVLSSSAPPSCRGRRISAAVPGQRRRRQTGWSPCAACGHCLAVLSRLIWFYSSFILFGEPKAKLRFPPLPGSGLAAHAEWRHSPSRSGFKNVAPCRTAQMCHRSGHGASGVSAVQRCPDYRRLVAVK